jgi:hypothetical protein
MFFTSYADKPIKKSLNNKEINKENLLKIIMGKLGLTEEDIQKDPEILNSIIRENKINSILS